MSEPRSRTRSEAGTSTRHAAGRIARWLGLAVIALVTLSVLLVAPNPVAERGPVVDLCDSSTLCENGVHVVAARSVDLSLVDQRARVVLLPIGVVLLGLAGLLVGLQVRAGFLRCLDRTVRCPALDPLRCRVRRRGPPALRAS